MANPFSSSGDLANPLLSTDEARGSMLAVALALVVPGIFGVVVIVALGALVIWGLHSLAGLDRMAEMVPWKIEPGRCTHALQIVAAGMIQSVRAY